jgi:hypothetical protein
MTERAICSPHSRALLSLSATVNVREAEHAAAEVD